MSEDQTESTEGTGEEAAAPVDANRVKALAIFEAGHEESKSRDQIIVGMVQDGLSLNYAQNIYKELAKDAGMEVTRGGHRAEALQVLNAAEIPDEEFAKLEIRQELRAQLQAKFGVAESTANDYLKAYAKANEIELPGGGGPSSEMAGNIFDFVMANPDTDKAAFKAFMEGHNRSKGNIDENWRGVLLARRLLGAGYEFTAEVEAESEAA